MIDFYLRMNYINFLFLLLLTKNLFCEYDPDLDKNCIIAKGYSFIDMKIGTMQVMLMNGSVINCLAAILLPLDRLLNKSHELYLTSLHGLSMASCLLPYDYNYARVRI